MSFQFQRKKDSSYEFGKRYETCVSIILILQNNISHCVKYYYWKSQWLQVFEITSLIYISWEVRYTKTWLKKTARQSEIKHNRWLCSFLMVPFSTLPKRVSVFTDVSTHSYFVLEDKFYASSQLFYTYSICRHSVRTFIKWLIHLIFQGR